MISPNQELMKLLSAALGLIHSPESDEPDVVRIGGAPYRIIAKHEEGCGWIVVLIAQTGLDACDDVLRTCYGLTHRELQVARLLADRHSNKEIADVLDVKESTAARHTENILRKLGIESRREVRDKLYTPALGVSANFVR